MAAYERWLVPKGNVFRPSGAAVSKLVARLRGEKWIVDPAAVGPLRFEGARDQLAAATGGLAVRTVDNTFGGDRRARLLGSAEPLPAQLTSAWIDDSAREELRIVWPVDAEDTRLVHYPLSRAPSAHRRDDRVSFTLEIHLSHDYVYPARDGLEPIPTECACGDDLSFAWDEDDLVPAFPASTGIFAECEACARTFDPAKGAAKLVNPIDGSFATVRGGAAYRFALKAVADPYVHDAALAFNLELVALVEDEFGRDFYQFAALS
jgi:hypothetical protein